jgi:hypothetical protein
MKSGKELLALYTEAEALSQLRKEPTIKELTSERASNSIGLF